MNDQVMTAEKPKMKSIHHFIRDEELSVRIHTDETVFTTLETEWSELAHLSNQLICMSSLWASRWWKYFGRHKNRSLFIVTVYDNQKLVAIFPFYKGVTTLGGITLQQRLRLIGSGGSPNEKFGFSDDYGISDFLDVIVHPEYKADIADLFVKLLLSPQLSDYQITLHQARDDSYIMQTIYPLLNKAQRRLKKEHTDICSYIDVDRKGDLKEFIKGCKSNARRRFRQTLRARGDGNDFIIEGPDGLDDVEQMLERLIQLHQDRWHAIGYPGAFQDERFTAFFKEISIAAYQEDRLWIKQAVDESGVCSVRMLLKYNRRYYDYMSGYDDDSPSSRRRPGIGLLLDLVAESLKQPIDRVELLRGDEGYKYDFTHLALNNWKITIPEVRQWKTGWGLSAALAQFCSVLVKYFNRERTLLLVQYRKAGFLHMISGYFNFRKDTVIHKINEMKKTE